MENEISTYVLANDADFNFKNINFGDGIKSDPREHIYILYLSTTTKINPFSGRC